MEIITLTTDLGLKDYYVASVKGAILKELPDATIVDISHEIPPFDVLRAAFIIKNAYQNFPEGSVHIIGINSSFDIHTPHVATYYNKHYFIGADNGIFSLIFKHQPDKVVELTLNQDTDYITFPTKDVFVKAACHIARGGSLDVIGKSIHKIVEKTTYRAVTDSNTIKGIAIYIDHYGNIITNISEQLFKEYGKGRKFKILFRSADYEINTISKSYNEVVEGERIALISSTGNIEIAINKHNASKLFGIEQGDTIRIDFYD